MTLRFAVASLVTLAACHDFEADYQVCRGKGACGVSGPNGNAKLEFRPAALSFGPRPLGQTTAPSTVQLFNTGTESSGALTTVLSLSGDAGSDFAVQTDRCTGFSVAPDAGCSVDVVFTPALGLRTATLEVREVGSVAPHALAVDGTGVGVVLIAAPPSVDFTVVMAGELAGPQPITLTNTGLLDSARLAFSLSGSALGFRFDAGTCAQVGLDAGASCEVSVLLIGPDAGGPALSGSLTVTAGSTQLDVPLNGVVFRPGQLALSPRNVDAGNIELGMSKTLSFTLANSGIAHSGPLTWSLISDAGAYAFDGGTCTAAGLAGTLSCQLNVSVAPPAAQPYVTTLLASSADGGDAVATLFARGIEVVPLSLAVSAAVGADHVTATSSDGRMLDCPAGSCATSVQRGSTVNLVAAPGGGRVFAGWSGSCSGYDASCRLVPVSDAGASVTAAFAASAMLTVNVTGPGVVVSDPPRISCPPTCAAVFPQAMPVKLDPPITGSRILGPLTSWAGCDLNAAPHCEVTLAGNRTVDATFTRANVAFITSQTVPPTLGSLAAYDAVCLAAATDAGLGITADAGHWVSWMSSAAVAAAQRVQPAIGFVRPDGRLITGGEFGGLHRIPVTTSERLGDLSNTSAYTGTRADGGLGTNCNDWSDAGPGPTVTIGQGYDVEPSWTDTSNLACNAFAGLRVYCVQTDFTAPLPLPVRYPSMRLAFASRGVVSSLAGLPGFDALCVGEATDAGLPGTYLAFVSTLGQSALSRFRPDAGMWVRIDGLPFALDLATFSQGSVGGTIDDIHLDATGQPVSGDAFTGHDAPASAGPPSFSCNGWAADSGSPRSDTIGRSATIWGAGSLRCGQVGHVYCFQD